MHDLLEGVLPLYAILASLKSCTVSQGEIAEYTAVFVEDFLFTWKELYTNITLT